MAKKSNPKQSPEITVVKSRAYGTHSRAARGTVKKAQLNAAFEKNAKRAPAITSAAKEVHNQLIPCAGFFKERMFWQTLLSRMHKATETDPLCLLTSIEQTDLNESYPIARFGNMPRVQTETQGRILKVILSSGFPLRVKGGFTAYCFDVIVVFFNGKGKGRGRR